MGYLASHFLVIGSAQPSDHVQKCDARRPCTTCIRAKCASECVYDEKDPQSAGTYHLHNLDGRLSWKCIGDTDPAAAPKEISAAPRTLKAEKSSRPSGLTFARRNSFEQSIPLNSNPSISIISSFLHPIIPSEPWIPLSFLGEEKLQLQFNESGATDLDMKLCVLN